MEFNFINYFQRFKGIVWVNTSEAGTVIILKDRIKGIVQECVNTSEAGTVGLKANHDLPAGVRPRTNVPLLPRL